jgi:glycosyltransferase involved in cell wall biosynthesis
MYEYWIEIKIREIEKTWKQTTENEVKRLLGAPPGGEPNERPCTDDPPLIEVMIPTFNEASHIAETVRNARQLGPVYVLDSFSTDGTQQIARDAGATVVEHKFENYSRQKNWGLENLPFRGKWVFILDADERLTPELIAEVRRTAANPGAASGYYVNRVVVMMGRQIRHGGAFPSWNLRFFKRGACRYEDRSVHEHMLCDGPTAYMDHLMLHIRRESISEYLSKHIRYADMESNEWVKLATGGDGSARAGRLFRNLLKYRLYLRRDVWPRLPFKPAVRFVWMYFFKLGILDGKAGWHLANLMASYEYMIQLLYLEKMDAIRRKRAGLPPA